MMMWLTIWFVALGYGGWRTYAYVTRPFDADTSVVRHEYSTYFMVVKVDGCEDTEEVHLGGVFDRLVIRRAASRIRRAQKVFDLQKGRGNE